MNWTLKSLVFWRNVVAICILLLVLDHPKGGGSVVYYLGFWFATLVITFGLAAIVVALAYLFLTSIVRRRALKSFVFLSWAMATLLLFSQWFLLGIARDLAAEED